MESLSDLLTRLEPSHRDALRWFDLHAGETTDWPSISSDDFRLVTKAKGIYKPKNQPYALSVRQTLDSPYNDQPPQYHSDGTWTYPYFQEGLEGGNREDMRVANRSLLICAQDGVPVGVLRQLRKRVPVRYEVLGLAIVSDFRDGYFYLEGFAPGGFSHSSNRSKMVNNGIEEAPGGVETLPFDPERIRDLRQRALAFVVQRPDQARFRSQLLDAYSGVCAISGANALPALEAAHILPYRGAETNHTANGLLLRADLHLLFDKGLLAVATDEMRVVLAPSLTRSTYSDIAGHLLRLPAERAAHPSVAALDEHRQYAQAVWDNL